MSYFCDTNGFGWGPVWRVGGALLQGLARAAYFGAPMPTPFPDDIYGPEVPLTCGKWEGWTLWTEKGRLWIALGCPWNMDAALRGLNYWLN